MYDLRKILCQKTIFRAYPLLTSGSGCPALSSLHFALLRYVQTTPTIPYARNLERLIWVFCKIEKMTNISDNSEAFHLYLPK